MKAPRKLRGTKVVIKEDLTKENKNFLKATVASNKISNAWSWDERIFITEESMEMVCVIHCLTDINKL